MKLPNVLSHATKFSIGLFVFLALLVAGCGGGGGEPSPAPTPSIEWIKVDSIFTSPTAASLGGTAWVSQSYYASHCVGIGCFLDTTRTDDYPGVDVTFVNLTTGVSGKATSYYGPGTSWVHEWGAGVPVITGKNTIQISAYDPSGKGGSSTVDVVAPWAPLGVQSTSPLAGATIVPVSSAISATFNYQVDAQSVTSSSFIVSGPSGALAGSLAVNGSTVSFTPINYFAYDTTYTATITTAVKGVNGEVPTTDYSWTFTAGFTRGGNHNGVWGSSGNDVFVVGFGPILHYDRKGWVDMTEWNSGTHSSLTPPFHWLFSI